MDETQGFWTGRAPPAVVDWCEPNYVVTPYVAEFWNTLTSLPMVALGLYGLWRWWQSDPELPRRFAWCFVGLAVVGVGSTAFHGTLLRPAQALDELPMVYAGLVGTWVLWHRTALREEGRGAAWVIGLYAVGFTAAYFTMRATFEVFLATYVAVVAYLVLATAWHAWIEPSPRLVTWLPAVAAGSFLGSFALCWLPEHVFLPCDHALQSLPLHAIWHVGAGTGTYVWFLWLLADRWRVKDTDARLDAGFVVPNGPLEGSASR